MKNMEASDFIEFDEQGMNIYQNYLEIISTEFYDFGKILGNDILEPFLLGKSNTEESFKEDCNKVLNVSMK